MVAQTVAVMYLYVGHIDGWCLVFHAGTECDGYLAKRFHVELCSYGVGGIDKAQQTVFLVDEQLSLYRRCAYRIDAWKYPVIDHKGGVEEAPFG